MQTTTFEAALTWEDEMLAHRADGGLRRRLALDARGECFGLLEADAHGWTLCIPDGAQVEASLGGTSLDLGGLSPDAGGERRLRVRAGLCARVRMGEFRFEVLPSA